MVSSATQALYSRRNRKMVCGAGEVLAGLVGRRAGVRSAFPGLARNVRGQCWRGFKEECAGCVRRWLRQLTYGRFQGFFLILAPARKQAVTATPVFSHLQITQPILTGESP